jgi:hypothetical protein
VSDPEQTARDLRKKQEELEAAVENNAVLNVHALATNLAALHGALADHIDATAWTVLVDVEISDD